MRLPGLALALLALTAASPPTWATFRTDEVSIRYPPGWHATARQLTPVNYPWQRFAVASYPFPANARPNGCKPAGTLAKRQPSGAVIFVIEYGAGSARVFPPRPARLKLSGFRNYECFGRSYQLRFREAGRYFQIHIAFGRRAGAGVRATVLRILDSFEAKAR
ncbi:MAG TPA: hypothetical protein VFO56_08705 [Gaiellaceae bacterium]|nr:hypothetical protein [Gaiellaceae bacterium]